MPGAQAVRKSKVVQPELDSYHIGYNTRLASAKVNLSENRSFAIRTGFPSEGANPGRASSHRENFLYFSLCGMILSAPKRRFLSSS